MKPKRYKMTSCGEPECAAMECDDGDWVRAEDYAEALTLLCKTAQMMGDFAFSKTEPTLDDVSETLTAVLDLTGEE